MDFVSLRKKWQWTPLFCAGYLIAIVVATIGWVSLLAWIGAALLSG
jgi:hypothetical protein